MALKLFRSTGYSTLLQPGETRVARHPVVVVAAVSLWLGVACNVGLWRLLLGQESLRDAVAATALLAGGSAVVLSLLGWRRTLKLASTVLLLFGALLACGLWAQELPIDSLWEQRPRALLPGWTSFLRWQGIVLMLLLAVFPIVALWNLSLRRLQGPAQMRWNLVGAAMGAVLLAAGFAAAG
jgi:glucan phosphoethanolaminetransferase (alkaline phosphatase superfamily)